MAYQEGRMFLTPLRFDADVGGQVYDRCPATGNRKQISCYLKYFIRVEILQNNILQNSFIIGSRIKNSDAELDWDSRRSRCIDTVSTGVESCIIDTHYLHPGMMKPERIAVSLVVNSNNHGTLENAHTVFCNISSGGMREHNAGPVVIGKDQWTLEGTRCQHYFDRHGYARPECVHDLAGAAFPRWSLRRSMATT